VEVGDDEVKPAVPLLDETQRGLTVTGLDHPGAIFLERAPTQTPDPVVIINEENGRTTPGTHLSE
jgi:hypothetical protein